MKPALFVLFSAFLSVAACAQNKKPGMPAQGFWVIETNVKTPRYSQVFFYTNEGLLVNKQEVSGKKLNPHRPRVVRQLNALLLQSLLAWQKANRSAAPLASSH